MAPRPITRKYGVSIVTSDPVSGIIEAVAKGGNHLRISVVATPVAFRWPVAGEAWMVRQENGNWYLEAPYPQTSPTVNITTIAPGDVVLSSPTGQVWVLGSTDGSTDFSFEAASFPVRGRATLVTGAATVNSTAVQAVSDIYLTGQDNNTTGILRVSARVPGTSFTITSSNAADSGVVAYLIYA